jgi:hypothetical protein
VAAIKGGTADRKERFISYSGALSLLHSFSSGRIHCGAAWHIEKITHSSEKVTINWICFMYIIQHCFICRPSDSTLSEDAEIEARTVATLALAARCSH